MAAQSRHSDSKPGAQFEKIVADVHRRILKKEVQENQRLPAGNSRYRQIDAVLQETTEGQHRFVIIECKDHRRKAEVGKVDELIGKIEDVSASRGILVSKAGFTTGAIDRAKKEPRVQLSEVFDVEALESRLCLPTTLRIRRISTFNLHIHRVPGPMGNALITFLKKRLHSAWNEARLNEEIGTHTFSETFALRSTEDSYVTYTYTVGELVYFKALRVEKGCAINNAAYDSGTFFFESVESIEVARVEQEWRKCSSGETLPPSFDLTFAAFELD